MTLQDAYNLLESLKIKTTLKPEIRVYEKFIYILSELKKRELTTDEIQSIENELEGYSLDSSPDKRKKYYRKALTRFEKYLKDTFSLVSKGHYTRLYGGLGLTFGLLFGIVFLSSWERSMGISMGLILGMVLGAVIGRAMDTKAISQGRVL